MSTFDDEVIQDYLAESREHLADIESDLLAIEQRGADIDEERVNKVFRAAHSIKGGAGFFDLSRIRELAHRIENMLDLIRSRQAQVTTEVVNVLLLAFDKLRDLVDHPAESQEADISEFVTMLEDLAAAHLPQSSKDSLSHKAGISTATRQTRLVVTEFDFDSARKIGRMVYLLEYDLLHDIQRKNKKPLEVVKELMGYGAILDTAFDMESVGTLEEDSSNRLLMDVLYATALGPELIGTVVDIPAERIWTAAADGYCQPLATASWPGSSDAGGQTAGPRSEAPTKEEATPPERITALEPPPAAAVSGEAKSASAAPKPAERPVAETALAEAAPGVAADATVRLNVALLDALMNLAGELVLGRNQLSDAIARRDQAMIQAASQRISVVTSDVQDTVMRTRMQPLGNLFQKFPRLVRDTARKLGKEVRLVEEGGEVELDKTIIEGLGDPLTHLVRNAVDHGIETPPVRVALGKPAAGTLFLRAWHEAGMVVVEVADDGRGLDPEKIAAAAVAKGLVTAQAVAAMAYEERLALALLPGLSTAQRVSDVSGRGVGLDVVKTNLDRLGGKVEIQSQAGKGAAFRIKLPLTLAIIPSLLVSSGADRLAIPLANVLELARIPAAEVARRIDRVGSASVLMLRDGVVPLVHLERVLGLPESPAGQAGAMNVVVLSSDSYRYGLVVERLHGTVEIVVKPLGRHMKHLREYAGATILGDGCVALIADVAGLAAVAGLSPQEVRVLAAQDEVRPEETHHLLLFRNSPEEACAVPLSAVARVVKVQPEEVERVGGRRTMQHRGRNLPLVTLADAAKVGEVVLDQDTIVVVIETGGREFGLLAARPVDVLETALEVDPYTLKQACVAGSAIVRGRTTLVLDPCELAGVAWPERNREEPERRAALGATVLVAEDSTFFREQVVKIIEGEGYRTLSAPDGQAAWEIVEQRANEVSLVVTDVEMPRLDGLQLTRRIRAGQHTATLPVVLLTSLAGEDDMERGRAAGATAYCIKLDRDQLIEAVRESIEGGPRAERAGDKPGLMELSRRLDAEGETWETSPANIGGTR
jgi:two-component system chemotaxis sensor kinase CheA